MASPSPLKPLLRKSSFQRVFVPPEEIFIHQRDDFSCAAACFATIARLYQLAPDKDLRFFQKALSIDFNGVFLENMEDVCTKHLPAIRIAHDSYRGGIALASIMYKPGGVEHVVIFLGRKDKTIVYYDPMDHKIWRDDVRNMQRAGTWTAYFPRLKGANFQFWADRSEPNPFPLKKQAFWLKVHGVKKPVF